MKKALLIVLISISIFSCEKPKSQSEMEHDVFVEIFSDVLDSVYKDRRLFIHFPPSPEPIFDANGKFIKDDTTGMALKLKEHKIQEIKIKSDTLNNVIAVDPKLHSSNRYNNASHFNEVFKGIKFRPIDTIHKLEIISKIKTLKLKKSDRIISSDELPKIHIDDIFAKKLPFQLTGIYSFSRITFDTNYNYGVLDAGYYCGGKCGRGFLIYIKKVNGKWKIHKVERTWIS